MRVGGIRSPIVHLNLGRKNNQPNGVLRFLISSGVIVWPFFGPSDTRPSLLKLFNQTKRNVVCVCVRGKIPSIPKMFDRTRGLRVAFLCTVGGGGAKNLEQTTMMMLIDSIENT